MRHSTAPRYWRFYNELPVAVRNLADRNFRLLLTDPSHSSLQFKKVGKFWSVRVGDNHRALALRKEVGFVWFWIGPHDEYDRLIR